MRQRRKPVHAFVSANHKKATKCDCYRPGRKVINRVSVRPTLKKIFMMIKWKKDELGRVV